MAHRPPRAELRAAVSRRTATRLAGMPDDAVHALLADAVYLERRRFSGLRGQLADEDRAEREAVEAAAHHIRGDRRAWEGALHGLVERYFDEVHNDFSDRAYRFATRLLPGMLTRLLTAASPTDLLTGRFDPASRIRVQGEVERLARLGAKHTLVLAPTHLSNLDSPLLGYALYAAGLPPVIYGAGLNLFSNPAMAFFMRRLGAYTVDRRKKHELYKDVLKDYSTEAIGRGQHSLFFPGGTRARTGAVEARVKKGLLGTALTAWQEGLQLGRPQPEVLVVPCTLSYAMVLEAETLIEDALQETGKSRYIITDDEFSEPRTVATFARKVLDLDASVTVHFGAPLDLLGNPVDEEGRSLDVGGGTVDRRRYVTDADGRVIVDEQRDRVYTERLGEALVKAWHRDNLVLETHVAALAAWQQLRRAFPRLNPWQLCLLQNDERVLPRPTVLAAIERVLGALRGLEDQGQIRTRLPSADPAALLAAAEDRFARFHSEPALQSGPLGVRVYPKLALYYGNRLEGYGLEPVARGAAAEVA